MIIEIYEYKLDGPKGAVKWLVESQEHIKVKYIHALKAPKGIR